MQCIWSKAYRSIWCTTINTLPRLTHPNFASSLRLPYSTPSVRLSSPHFGGRRAISSSVRSSLAPQVALQQKSQHFVSPADSLGDLSATPPPSLTRAQVSLAASRAVRVSCQNGAVADASYILNSLRGSAFTKEIRNSPIGNSLLKRTFYPIDFGGSVSPRLAAHGLLHHFIRAGEVAKAHQCARRLVRDGIKLRSTTLHAVIAAQVKVGVNPLRSLLPTKRPSGPDILTLRPDMASEEGVRYAISLVLLARRHRQRCSDHTYQSIIHACLLHGEIIAGSLLFVILIKDWEIKQKLRANLKAQIAEDETRTESAPRHLQGRWAALLADSKRAPPKRFMNSILARCEEDMLLDPGEDSAQTLRSTALQALANLAGLLDRRILPFTDVSSLVRVLSRCPKVPDKVWVVEGGREKPSRVEAYAYFHRVLHSFAHSPSYAGAHFKELDRQNRMPPLSRETYNSLLHYALRHRQSIPLATKVLHHMEHERSPPLKPDVATYNIVVRSGTLLRRNDLSEMVLAQLRKAKENEQHGITVHKPSPLSLIDEPPVHSISSLCPDAKRDAWTNGVLSADAHTLTSYIMHLTSTGQPQVVADVLFHVLPELSAVDHPSWGAATEENRKEMRRLNRDQRLARAVILGPWFFAAVLNALCKAGKTGLTERVWLLAKQAERASWTWAQRYGEEVQPWCLPVHAYTIMLQCYGAEARKGLRMRRPGSDQADWVPRSKLRVRGWAYFILATSKAQGDLSRRTSALRSSAVLYRAMFRGAQNIYDTLVSVGQADTHKIHIPRPDARFFNAALELFGRQPSMRTRNPHTSPARWSQKSRTANFRYTRYGKKPRGWNPFLMRLVKEMVTAGYPVPAAFQRLFTGHLPLNSTHFKDKVTLNQQPFKFPPPKKRPFRPHALSTLKERGVPIRHREWTQTGLKWRWKRRKRTVKQGDESNAGRKLS
ncbi:hypothetical protein BJ138DRAFT_1178815 [Hygrophoropsis aurantiaca]|uniref:Uncharacterized protein n=1 Tax=Hygrophoropsis aurantiaca TaxID=72124 RepID=A0ACB8AHS7_9AGAM|nr:hypothetical protein BJ138DRAFT_1178815 [Hygrophoropsis aurantiaca]